MQKNSKKITIEISQDLLERAMDQTSKGITETIRQGLYLLSEASTYKELKNLKGKGKFNLSWKKLKEDR